MHTKLTNMNQNDSAGVATSRRLRRRLVKAAAVTLAVAAALVGFAVPAEASVQLSNGQVGTAIVSCDRNLHQVGIQVTIGHQYDTYYFDNSGAYIGGPTNPSASNWRAYRLGYYDYSTKKSYWFDNGNFFYAQPNNDNGTHYYGMRAGNYLVFAEYWAQLNDGGWVKGSEWVGNYSQKVGSRPYTNQSYCTA